MLSQAPGTTVALLYLYMFMNPYGNLFLTKHDLLCLVLGILIFTTIIRNIVLSFADNDV
jgi:hypothetical protein